MHGLRTPSHAIRERGNDLADFLNCEDEPESAALVAGLLDLQQRLDRAVKEKHLVVPVPAPFRGERGYSCFWAVKNPGVDAPLADVVRRLERCGWSVGAVARVVGVQKETGRAFSTAKATAA